MRLTRTLAAAVLAALTLAGCTFVGPADEQPADERPAAEPYSIKHGAVLAALGPVPQGEPMTPERTADFIQRFQDYRWELVAKLHPDAVRPAVTVVDTTGASVAACMSNGEMSEQAALSDYVCLAQNSAVPSAALSDEQAGYLYDYWTGFVVPCYAANDHEVHESPPTRDEFVTRWPFQQWSPRPATLGGEEVIAAFEELDQFCPTTIDELS
ncbi:MAG: hypothetical protein JWQ74_3740 [Marmoricola sp.]|nr:hypothetical protein [Marmoricola sp.]